MKKGGWNFDVSHQHTYYKYARECGTSTWYGFKYGYPIGSVTAIFAGSGKATLNFGNCYASGRVVVYLNEKDIGHADANTPKQEITFDYSKGDNLTIKEENMAIIKLNSLNLSCADSKYAM